MLKAILNYFRPKEPPAPPVPLSQEERYPEILHWRKGDHVVNDHYPDNEFTLVNYNFEAVSPDGYIYLKSYGGSLYRHSLSSAMRCLTNQSLRDRNLSEEVLATAEYMALIAAFQQSLAELKFRQISK